MSRHLGNIFWQGPRQDSQARPLAPAARRLLAELRERMKSQRQAHGVAQERLPDGTRLLAMIQHHGNVPLYRIFAFPGGLRPSTVVLASGLFEGRRSHPNTVSDGYFSDVQFVTGTGGSYQRTAFVETVELLGSLGYWASGTYDIGGTRQAVPNPGKLITTGAWFPPLNSYSMEFSGEMCKVVQLLNGMGQPHNFWSTFARTHGIWVGSDSSRWVIEISSDDGITAWPLPRTSLTPDDILLGGGHMTYKPTPTSTTYGDMPPLSERIQLLAVGAMSEYFSHTPIHTMMGFSFSDDGHNATNVTRKIYSDGGVYSWKSYLWELSISGGNTPSTATLTQEYDAFLYYDNHDITTVRYPEYNGTSGTALDSLFMSFSSGSSPADYSQKAPVFSMYTPEGRVVVYFKARMLENEAVDTRPGGTTYGNTFDDFGAPYSEGSGSFQLGNYSKAVRAGFIVEGPAGWELPPHGVPVGEDDSWDTVPKTYSYEWEQMGGDVFIYDSVESKRAITSEHWRVKETLVTYQNLSPVSYWTRIILPFHNRNCFYFAMWTAGKQTPAKKYTYTCWQSYAKGNAREVYPFASAYYASYENPCECGWGSPLLPTIGYWMPLEGTYSSSWVIDGRYVLTGGGGIGGIPMKSPIHDPNAASLIGIDCDVSCWDQRGKPVNDCLWDEGARGGCADRWFDPGGTTEENLDEVVLPHQKLYYFDKWRNTGQLVYEETETLAINLENTGWIIGLGGLNPPDPANYWMDACIDAFTGGGSISVYATYEETLNAAYRYDFLNAHTLYAFGEQNLRPRGFFGAPFPEYM